MTEDINSLIFRALQVSKLSKVPFLFMGNPGTGKTTSVEMYCDAMGYKMILLRGSQSSPEEILGYDVNEGREDHTATRLIPKWFAELKRNHDEGKKILLFLDEITTASEYVQGALLHLIFERRVGDELLPDDTLIVAAGNYASNLSSNFNLIPPLMNRFCIFNITPSHEDLRVFLSKYQKNISDTKMDRLKELTKVSLSGISSTLDEEMQDGVKALIENSIYELVDQVSKTNELDLSITELKDIYQDVENASLPGFISYRSLNYYRECSIAMYLQYGIEGLKSDCFKLITLGLVGIGMGPGKNNGSSSRGSQSYEPVAKKFDDRFSSTIITTVQEFEKTIKSKSNKYTKPITDLLVKYFKDAEFTSMKDTARLSSDDLTALDNIVRSMTTDSNKGILSESLVRGACNLLLETTRDICKSQVTNNLNQMILEFNTTVSIFKGFKGLVDGFRDLYAESIKSDLDNIEMSYKKLTYKISTIKATAIKSDPQNATLKDLQEIKGINAK